MKKPGITLELIIATSVVAILICIGVYFFGTGSPEMETAARIWAQDMGYIPVHSTCSRMDSDGDIHVSCDIRIQEQGEPIALECNWLTGDCKIQRW